jgi:hypothetical protein
MMIMMAVMTCRRIYFETISCKVISWRDDTNVRPRRTFINIKKFFYSLDDCIEQTSNSWRKGFWHEIFDLRSLPSHFPRFLRLANYELCVSRKSHLRDHPTSQAKVMVFFAEKKAGF